MSLVKLASSDEIDAAIARMAVAFQREIDEVTIRVYRKALADLPLWAIEDAEVELQRKGGTFFPSSALWHQTADALIEARRRDLLTRPSTPEFECELCRDTGWVDEDRNGRNVCVICSCRPTNTNYQRMTLASRKGRDEEVK